MPEIPLKCKFAICNPFLIGYVPVHKLNTKTLVLAALLHLLRTNDQTLAYLLSQWQYWKFSLQYFINRIKEAKLRR